MISYSNSYSCGRPYGAEWELGSWGRGNEGSPGYSRFVLEGRESSDVVWKLVGNLGGEEFVDKTRGPLNEGVIYAEWQVWHLRSAPTGYWMRKSPFEGINAAGVGFIRKTRQKYPFSLQPYIY